MRTRASYKVGDYVDLDGYALPRKFQVEFINDDDQPDLVMDFAVSSDQRVECRALTLRAKAVGREVQLRDVRGVRVGDFLETAVQLVAMPVLSETRNEDGTVSVEMLARDPRATNDERGAVRAVTRHRARVTPARLTEVADLVRTADGNPVRAVQDALDVAQRTAQLWIKRARETTNPETGRPYLEAPDA